MWVTLLFAKLTRRAARPRTRRGNRRRAPTNAFRPPERRKHLERRFSRRRRRRHLFVGVSGAGSRISRRQLRARRSCASPKNVPTIDASPFRTARLSRASFCPRESSRTLVAQPRVEHDDYPAQLPLHASSISASTSPLPRCARRTRLATRSADAPTFRASMSTARRRPSRVPPRARPSRRSRAQHHLSAVPNLPPSAPTPTRSLVRARASLESSIARPNAARSSTAPRRRADDASTEI